MSSSSAFAAAGYRLLRPLMLTGGQLTLRNRVIMAPLTRGRAGPTRVPTELMATYYAQRASAGLIVAEATAVSEQGYGWPNAPGIYTPAHVEGWRKVTHAYVVWLVVGCVCGKRGGAHSSCPHA